MSNYAVVSIQNVLQARITSKQNVNLFGRRKTSEIFEVLRDTIFTGLTDRRDVEKPKNKTILGRSTKLSTPVGASIAGLSNRVPPGHLYISNDSDVMFTCDCYYTAISRRA